VARFVVPTMLALLLALTATPSAAGRVAESHLSQVAPVLPAAPEIAWRESEPVGLWWAGRLRRGVQLPAEGPDWFTWDPVLKRTPNRGWRRWGADRLIRTVLAVLAEYRAANPFAPRVGVGDLSRRHGGDFGPRFGGLGHMSHQNGLDADFYYPREDGLERRPYHPSQVDEELAQDLVDRFVAAGARTVYVGPRLSLRGPRRVVVPLVHHDDHLHVRLP
jgi:murein endopeptidase